MDRPRYNTRLLNQMLLLYVAAALVAAGLIALGVWNTPAPTAATSASGKALANALAQQRLQQNLFLQLGVFVAFAWVGGVLLLRLRTSYMGAMRQIWTLREEIVELNQRDPLTGIGNRRAMPDALVRIFAQADRESKPLAIAVLGVDKLRELNESQGYKAGDTCLMSVAANMQMCARRPMDLSTRLGGDMFLVCWYDTNGEHALRLAESLRDKTRAMPLRRPGDAPMTLSIGLARRPPGAGLTWERLLQQAEDAMRHAKSVGGDQIAGV